MIVATVTIILGGVCIHNFKRGLQPYIQRGAKKEEIGNRAELRKESSGAAWVIDED